MKYILESYGVYDLRKIARAIGISAPTTLKRDDLIKAIKEKVNSGNIGKKDTTTSKAGRPPKITTDVSLDKLKLISELNCLKENVIKLIECMEDIEKTINNLDDDDSDAGV